MLQRIQQQKIQNTVRTTLLFLGMLGLMLALGYLLLGANGLIWAGALGSIMLFLSTRIPTKYIMRLYRGRELAPQEAPQLSRILRILAERSGLKQAPRLYYIPNRLLNAFATGDANDPAIGLTHGLLSQLTIREITGVLAHEMSHIRHRDYRLQGMVSVMGRLTRLFSMVGQFFLLLNLPLYLMGQETIPWLFVLLLIAAPSLSALMMTALSRTRERDADLEAARLTGDPNALADALLKLNYLNNGGVLERMIPRSLSSHPRTRERVQRLRELAPEFSPHIDYEESPWYSLDSPYFQRRSWWV